MEKKRKIYIFIKIILILLLVYIYIVDGKKMYLSETYQCLCEVLGGFRIALFPYLVLSIFSDCIVDSNKRTVFLTRLNFSFVFLICLRNLQLLFYVEGLEKENIEKKVFVYLYVFKNIGMLTTMFLYKFYFLVPINVNIAVTGTVLFFSSFVLFGKIIGNIIRKISKYYCKEKREERKKMRYLVKEKKQIKRKILEKEKREKIERKNQIFIEKTKEKKRKEKILELKTKIKDNQKILKAEQLNIDGIELTKKKELKITKVKVENETKIEKIAEGQLHFKFKTKEVQG